MEFNRNGEGNWIRKVLAATTDGSTAFNAGGSVRSYPNGGVWWVDGLLSAPSFFRILNGTLTRTIEIPTGETWGSCHHEFNFICKNSWGTDWHNKGYTLMSIHHFLISTMFVGVI